MQLLWSHNSLYIEPRGHVRVLHLELYPWRANSSKCSKWESQLDVCMFHLGDNHILKSNRVGIVIIAVIALLVAAFCRF
jgi:hypothetical protein